MELGNIQLNPNSAKEWLPNNKDYVYDTYLGERVTTPCHWPWSGLVINSDGGVSSCAIVDDQNADFGMYLKMILWRFGIMNIINQQEQHGPKERKDPKQQSVTFVKMTRIISNF